MKKFIGNKDFYKLVAALALPLLLQNAVSTFVNLLDNLMVGRIGTESMSGVSIVNQLLFVYNLCLFGGTGGAGIFGAQFFGRGDYNGVRHTLRFNILLCAGFTVIATVLLALIPDTLIGAFLHEAGTGGDLALTLSEGKDYLRIMLFGLPAFCLTTAYVSILRVPGDNRLPMKASIAAIFVNLVFNYLLIYGKLGFPMLGVRGAAIATVLSRYVEFGLILLGTHGKKTPPRFIRGLYRGFAIPGHLAGQIVRKGMPLLVNEMFWSLGMTMLTQCYSYRGLDAIAALNINSTVLNLFNTVIFTMGNTVGIIIGNLLGAELHDGDKVIMVEDVTTSGKSIDETYPILKAAADVDVRGLIVSLNRMEVGKGGVTTAQKEIEAKYGFPVASIVSMAEVKECLHNHEVAGRIVIDDDIAAAIDAYYEQWGAKE